MNQRRFKGQRKAMAVIKGGIRARRDLTLTNGFSLTPLGFSPSPSLSMDPFP